MWLFRHPAVWKNIYYRFFDGKRKPGTRTPGLLDEINPAFLCLTVTIIHFALSEWATGIWKADKDF